MQFESESAAPERRRGRAFLSFLLAFVLAGGAFFSGVQIGQGGSVPDQSANVLSLFFTPKETVVDQNEVDLSEFWRVWELLDDKFVIASGTPLTNEAKVQGAIDGLVRAYGDPYTVFMPPTDAAAFAEDISGNFSGVGMEVGIRENLVTIIAPLPQSPAERAGLLPGDAIIRINEVSTENMRIDDAVRLIRGEAGTVVELTVYREGETEFRTVSVTRENIIIPTVKTEVTEDAFYVALYSFNAQAESRMREAMRQYAESGTTKMILDLRGNPGGYLESAVAIAGYFLPSGKVVVREEFGDTTEDEVFRSRGRLAGNFSPQNLVVLVDNGSASASEILAGALHDHGTATIIGTDTFGKGSVQELVDLESGSSLKITVARWLTPAGTSISEGGLSPDFTIERTGEDRLAGVDPQKDAALAFLRGESIVSESPEEQTLETLE